MASYPAEKVLIRRRVLIATASNFAGKLVVMTIGFLLTPFVLHHIGATQFGIWVLVGSIVAYGSLLDLGINHAVVKYVAECRACGDIERASSLTATALMIYAALGLVALSMSVAAAPVVPRLFNVPPADHQTTKVLVLLLGVHLAISLPYNTAAAVLRGLQRYDLANAIAVMAGLSSAAATVIILLAGGGLIGMVAAQIPVLLAVQAITLWGVHRIAPELRFGWRQARRDQVGRVVSFSFYIFASHAAGHVQSKTDEIVIGAVLPVSAVTPYAIARRLSTVPQILAEQFLKIFLPLASQLDAENDRDRLRTLYLVGSRISMAILVPFGAVIILLAPALLTLWVGVGYAQYSVLVTVLCLAMLIETSQWAGMLILQGMARHRRLAVIWIYAAIANLGLSVVLVHTHGLVGVAFGTLIPTTVACLGFVLPHAMRVLEVNWFSVINEVFLPALLPAVPMLLAIQAAAWVLDSSSAPAVLLTAVLGFVIYAGCYLVATAGGPERALVKDASKKMLSILWRLQRSCARPPIHCRCQKAQAGTERTLEDAKLGTDWQHDGRLGRSDE